MRFLKSKTEIFVHKMSSYENLSFEDFKLWKVRELRVFLRDRGLKITGAKEELVALAYAACQL